MQKSAIELVVALGKDDCLNLHYVADSASNRRAAVSRGQKLDCRARWAIRRRQPFVGAPALGCRHSRGESVDSIRSGAQPGHSRRATRPVVTSTTHSWLWSLLEKILLRRASALRAGGFATIRVRPFCQRTGFASAPHSSPSGSAARTRGLRRESSARRSG